MLKNNVVIVLDQSGSMGHLKHKAKDYYNNLIAELKKKNKTFKQNTKVTLIEFDSEINVVFKNRDINKVRSMGDYKIGGNTSLLAAIDKSLDICTENTEDMVDDDASFLAIILTDGGENPIYKYQYDTYKCAALQDRIKSLINTDKFTLTIQVPNYLCGRAMSNIGFQQGNIVIWETTEEGFKEVEEKTSGGINSYYSARGSGARSVSNFYIQPDLTGVTKNTIKSILTPINNIFTSVYVNRDAQIRDAIERHTNFTYKKGCAYYQLTKNETVQSNKKVVILDKRDGKLYGGPEARHLIGLPDNMDAKVIPANFSNYEIFIQSTSVNRKVLKGTKIYVSLV